MVFSKHFTYPTETIADLAWKWEILKVDDWVKEHGVKLFHSRAEGVWYDAEGNHGYKFAWSPPSGMNWDNGRSGWKGGKCQAMK